MAFKEAKMRTFDEVYQLRDKVESNAEGRVVKVPKVFAYYVGTEKFIGDDRFTRTKKEKVIHGFYSDKTKTFFGVWGFPGLDKLMEKVPVRALCDIKYDGKGENANGQPYNKAKVMFDPDQTFKGDIPALSTINHAAHQPEEDDEGSAAEPPASYAPPAQVDDNLPF